MIANLGGLQAAAYRALTSANGAVVSRETLIDAMYGERHDGGPDCAEGCVRWVIRELRRKGAIVHTHGHSGWSLGGPRPVRVSPIETSLLRILREAGGAVVPHERLLLAGWDNRQPQNPLPSLRVALNRLRNNGRIDIRAVPGEGYYLVDKAA